VDTNFSRIASIRRSKNGMGLEENSRGDNVPSRRCAKSWPCSARKGSRSPPSRHSEVPLSTSWMGFHLPTTRAGGDTESSLSCEKVSGGIEKACSDG
jgi:hypothetical protein